MDAITFIRQALTQAHERLMATLGGLTDADAAWRPAPHANTILEIAWHVARVDDRLLRRATGLGPELWESQGWSERLGTTKEAGDPPVQAVGAVLRRRQFPVNRELGLPPGREAVELCGLRQRVASAVTAGRKIRARRAINPLAPGGGEGQGEGERRLACIEVDTLDASFRG
jgi:DinB family protein